MHESGRALCNDLIRRHLRLTLATHTRVDMEFSKPRARIAGNHDFGARHGLVWRQVLPWVRAQMVSAQDQPVDIKPDLQRDRLYIATKVSGRHPGVAAILVDLIAGRFDQYVRIMS